MLRIACRNFELWTGSVCVTAVWDFLEIKSATMQHNQSIEYTLFHSPSPALHISSMASFLLLPAVLLVAMVTSTEASLNVLLVSTVSSPSHHIWVNSLTEGLLRRGHHVTELVMRPPTKHANKTSFYITEKSYGEHPVSEDG